MARQDLPGKQVNIQEAGHKKQYLFNEQVRQVWDKVDVGSTAADTSCCREGLYPLQEGEKLINLQQKNILIADRSEHG